MITLTRALSNCYLTPLHNKLYTNSVASFDSFTVKCHLNGYVLNQPITLNHVANTFHKMTKLNNSISTIYEALKSLNLAIVKRLSQYQNVIIKLENENHKLQDANTLLTQKLSDYERNASEFKGSSTQDQAIQHTSLTLNELQSIVKRKQ